MSRRSIYEGTNGVPRMDNKVLHVDVQEGNVANRIITVGPTSRAKKFASFLSSIVFEHTSSRGFTTYTGYFNNNNGNDNNNDDSTDNGILVSIVSIGMGGPMMDMFIREVRNVVHGPMCIIRVGTCGVLREDVHVGSIVVCNGSIMISRDYDYFLQQQQQQEEDIKNDDDDDDNHGTRDDRNINENDCSICVVKGYNISKICPADEKLTALLCTKLNNEKDKDKGNSNLMVTTDCLNVTGESFYSTQGRYDSNFDDRNDTLIDTIRRHYPMATSCEMEAFKLLHLAYCSRQRDGDGDSNSNNSDNIFERRSIYAASMAIALANRPTGEVAEESIAENAEYHAGMAALKAITEFQL